jgi:hypothetical protein
LRTLPLYDDISIAKNGETIQKSINPTAQPIKTQIPVLRSNPMHRLPDPRIQIQSKMGMVHASVNRNRYRTSQPASPKAAETTQA